MPVDLDILGYMVGVLCFVTCNARVLVLDTVYCKVDREVYGAGIGWRHFTSKHSRLYVPDDTAVRLSVVRLMRLADWRCGITKPQKNMRR